MEIGRVKKKCKKNNHVKKLHIPMFRGSGNFIMLSRLNELELCGLFSREEWSRYDCYSVKNIPRMSSSFRHASITKLPGGVTICESLGQQRTAGGEVVINRPGVAGAVLQTASSLINSFIQWWFVKITLRCRLAPAVGHGESKF